MNDQENEFCIRSTQRNKQIYTLFWTSLSELLPHKDVKE